MWHPDSFFCQSRDILGEDLYWSSLKITTRLSGSWLEQNCSSLQGLELGVQLERERGSPASPGNDMGRVTVDGDKIFIVKNMWSKSPSFHADTLLEG